MFDLNLTPTNLQTFKDHLDELDIEYLHVLRNLSNNELSLETINDQVHNIKSSLTDQLNPIKQSKNDQEIHNLDIQDYEKILNGGKKSN